MHLLIYCTTTSWTKFGCGMLNPVVDECEVLLQWSAKQTSQHYIQKSRMLSTGINLIDKLLLSVFHCVSMERRFITVAHDYKAWGPAGYRLPHDDDDVSPSLRFLHSACEKIPPPPCSPSHPLIRRQQRHKQLRLWRIRSSIRHGVGIRQHQRNAGVIRREIDAFVFGATAHQQAVQNVHETRSAEHWCGTAEKSSTLQWMLTG